MGVAVLIVQSLVAVAADHHVETQNNLGFFDLYFLQSAFHGLSLPEFSRLESILLEMQAH